MKAIDGLFILTLTFKIVESCSTGKIYDLTYYFESSTNDILTCDNRAPVKAVSPGIYALNGPPALASIWDSKTNTNAYHCTMTEYFFIPALPYYVLITTFGDDYITVKINDVQVSEISTTAQCTYQVDKVATSYIKPGLNKLYIDANNQGSYGLFAYRLKIVSKFAA
ncbi:hypothetical protein SteCoe_7778 [Stentor coeruleus]|uniref:Malectin domain-containing protein n=1 Tax=Stentor coeruleus TaxID=5963 RepID=A0A1R2CLU2_9CILI|nr:hypothetical protein SteCoe_7778 [Stentor coeruleus]